FSTRWLTPTGLTALAGAEDARSSMTQPPCSVLFSYSGATARASRRHRVCGVGDRACGLAAFLSESAAQQVAIETARRLAGNGIVIHRRLIHRGECRPDQHDRQNQRDRGGKQHHRGGGFAAIEAEYPA